MKQRADAVQLRVISGRGGAASIVDASRLDTLKANGRERGDA
jgi:hypothetical protein